MKLQLAFLAASAAICQADTLALLKPVLAKMAERFTTRVTAVNNLHGAALTASTANFTYWPLCCDKDALTEVFHTAYGTVADTSTTCRRGPCTLGNENTNRTADMPNILGGTPACGNSVPGQKFYDACDKNTKDYEGTSWQFWGAETGLFLMFPAGGIGGPCSSDTYDCRKRPWYIRAKDALSTTAKDSVQFSSPYFGYDGKVLMVTASRSVSSAADGIFQGVVGIDMDITYLMEPLADVDAAADSYSFMIDGNNGEIMAHPKLADVPNFIENGKQAVKYPDVEPVKEINDKIAEILGKETGEFTVSLARWKTYRNTILDSEDATSADGFWDAAWTKENVQVSCTNLETSGAAIKYTICAVKTSMNMQWHFTLPILLIIALGAAAFVMKDKLGDGNQV